jgi:NDP-sugar pyrophosphorylase family protein
MKAMILAAGKGTRLGKITESIPKALVDLNGKTALQTAVEKCTSFGFDDIIINVHHFAHMVEAEAEKLRKAGFRIAVSDERQLLLETGGGLFRARNFFGKEPFLIYNVDIVSDIDLSNLYQAHLERSPLATLAVRSGSDDRVFLTDENGMVRGWRNRKSGEEKLPAGRIKNLSEVSFLGIHIIDPSVFRLMTDGVYSLTALYLELAADYEIFTVRNDGCYWLDIGSPDSLEAARGKLQSGK